jgi:hypothetical protein
MNRIPQLLGLCLALAVPPAFAANWHECNHTPVRLKSVPTAMWQDLCSIPEGSVQERAHFTALYETRNYVSGFSFGGGHRRIINGVCVIEHGDDNSETALVSRSDIDGALGLTITRTDGCTFSWEEEHITEADVMVASDLAFNRADESTVIRNAPAGTSLGALVLLHETGHALGLDHSSDFAVMRNGLKALAPFVGMSPTSGGLSSELTGDDVLGISHLYGYDPVYRNVFVSSQLLRNGNLVDNNIDPTRGDAQHPDPLLVCHGDVVNFYVSVGNDGSPREQFRVGVYADPDSNAYPSLNTPGPLALIDVAMNRGQASFPVQFTVPSGMPANVIENIFVSIETDLLWERKAYENFARSRLRLQVKPGC